MLKTNILRHDIDWLMIHDQGYVTDGYVGSKMYRFQSLGIIPYKILTNMMRGIQC